jgi:hypothetical protein
MRVLTDILDIFNIFGRKRTPAVINLASIGVNAGDVRFQFTCTDEVVMRYDGEDVRC